MTDLSRRAMTVVPSWLVALFTCVAVLFWAAAGWAVTPAVGTLIVNQATAQYGDAHGNPLSNVSNTVSAPLAGAPLLRLDQSASSDPVAAGAILTYTLHYANTGNAPATGVTLVDTLPLDVTFQSASGGGIHDPLTRTVTWNLDPLAIGAVGSLTVMVTVGEALPDGTTLVNTASLLAVESPPVSAVLTTTIGVGPHLLLIKSAAAPQVTPDGVISYTLAYQNIGNAPSHQTRITDQLPSGTALVADSAIPAVTRAGNLLSWGIGEVAAGSQGSVSFAVHVSPLATIGAAIDNFARIAGVEQTVISNTVTTYVSSQPRLELSLEAPALVRAGEELTCRIQVANGGAVPLTGVMLRVPLPVGTTFVAADNGGIFSSAEAQIVWSLGPLAVGQSQTTELVLRAAAGLSQGGTIETVATVLSNETLPQAVSGLSTVNARTPGMMVFLDADGQPTIGYHRGETIFVQVTDLDQNRDPQAIETVATALVDPQTSDSETLILTETGVATGIFRGALVSTREATTVNDGILTVAPDSRIEARYEDLQDGSPVSLALALIDPLGVVFDAFSGETLSGAIVTLRPWDAVANTCDLSRWPVLPEGEVNPSPATGTDGSFAFPLVPAGDYCFEVQPPSGYRFPSTVPDADLPSGFTVGNGSRGEKFTLQIGDPPLVRDIPVDPPAGRLTITKSAGKTTAALGDLIAYRITLTNDGDAPVTGITLADGMPHGIALLPGSSRLNGVVLADPTAVGERRLAWSLPGIDPRQSLEITYRAVVGPDALRGDGVNRATATGTSLGHGIASNTATVRVRLAAGIFTEKGTILGKIFLDRDGDRRQEQGAAAAAGAGDEPGIPNVVLYLEDGTRVISDRDGKFSLLGLAPGSHVLRVDEASLPPGMELVPLSSRFLGEGSSQFVAMPPGGMVQADFALRSGSTAPLPVARSDAGVAPASERLNVNDRNWEEAIRTLSPELDFLSPGDGAVLGQERTRVVLKVPFGTAPSLAVNGVVVDAAQIGRKIDFEPGKVTIYEYIDIPLPAGTKNLLRAEAKDPFGIVRGTREIMVLTAGAAARLVIRTDQAEVPADGVARIRVSVELQDKAGRIVPAAPFATVAVSSGEIVETDADPATEGFQIPLCEGAGSFTLRAPRETGEALITAETDQCRETARVFFIPHLRKLFLVGMGEVAIGRGQGQGAYSFLKEHAWFDDGLYSGGRGAFFLKGEVYQDVLLTAAYDSGKKQRNDLFRAQETTLDSEDKYPLYGDESKTSYEAPSVEKLYLKLEKNRSYLLYGDYRTELNATRLAAYHRTFNGFRYELNHPRLQVRAFDSYTDQTQVLDALPGKGISGYYFLSRRPVVDGSERVVIETRDRYRPERVVKRQGMSRGSDYAIDYEAGTILFKEAIPGRDADFNPLYIIVSYESRGSGEKFTIAGGRVSAPLLTWLEIGATGVVEEKALGDYHLLGTDLTLHLPGQTLVKAEYAETRGLFEDESVFAWHADDGWSLGVESKPTEALQLGGYYRTLGDYFQNLSAVDVSRGTTKYGLDGSYKVRPDTGLRGRYFEERDELNDRNYRQTTLAGRTTFAKTTIDLELSDEAATENYIPQAPPRSLFVISPEAPRDLTAAKLGLETELRPDLSLTLSHKHSLDGEQYQTSQAGLNYRINSRNRLYLRDEYQKYQERGEMRALFGVESEVHRDTVAFNEYRLASGAEGSRNQSVLGLRNKFFLGQGVTGNAAAEYLKTISGSQRENEPDAVAAALGLEYLVSEKLKVTSRAEHRRELSDEDRSYLGEVGAALKLGTDYSLLLRERYFLEEATGGEHTTFRSMVGLAWRPLWSNRFNALVKTEFKEETNRAATPVFREEAWIFAGEGLWQATRRLQLAGKYAGKLSRESDYSAYTDLVAGRFLFDLTDRWDIGAEYRILTSHQSDSTYQGGAAELGYRVIKNLWCAAGYSFDKFDADLTEESYQGEGPYLKLRVKIDEKVFAGVRKPRATPEAAPASKTH